MKLTTNRGAVLVLALLLNAGNCLTAQEIGKDVTTCISNGDANKLAEKFHSSIELELPGNEGTYSKTQAKQIMKNFFSKNPPDKFTINHKGASNDGSKYWIGTYKSGGNSFRTYCLAKKSGGKYIIQQLQFEKE